MKSLCQFDKVTLGKVPVFGGKGREATPSNTPLGESAEPFHLSPRSAAYMP